MPLGGFARQRKTVSMKNKLRVGHSTLHKYFHNPKTVNWVYSGMFNSSLFTQFSGSLIFIFRQNSLRSTSDARVNEKHMFYQHTIVGRWKSYENFHRNPVPSLQMHKYHVVSVDNGNILLLAVYLHIYTFQRIWHLSHEAIWSEIAHTCQLAKLVKSYFHPNHFFIFGFIQPGCVGFRFNRTWRRPIFGAVFSEKFCHLL